ncbi:hypotheticalsprotein [Cercospora beticola]|uniref:Hypotheticalsprotein n=1 Tax=Cercospora beticola TaxID=122368 RepID=A0A2G5IAD3_CERBT|nr:hypotheticalsprotein [Cercospora beticola]PIB01443.1 hypotheticalsprotein [Cercospora beticola]WPA96608.1 hypothetical protein RHO25_001215 [Cercospora beticola]CAK1355051.1 unnamed protein product [Cercospora beticola]
MRDALTLFGGDNGWHSDDWIASDDRVRGGKSISYLDCTKTTGTFRGTLDIKTLGGAGFASQRTTGDDREWDLSDYAGIELYIAKGDKKRYTFNLKDELLPQDPDTGREQSSISYECDFELPPQTVPGDAHDKTIFIPWSSFNATYRGRPKKDAKPIDLKKIKRFSIMMRSFFGTQEGDFSLSIRSISALQKVPKDAITDAEGESWLDPSLEQGYNSASQRHVPRGSVSSNTSLWQRRKGTCLLLVAVSVLAVHHLAGKYLHNCNN